MEDRSARISVVVQFPERPRHDLGLYEWLYTIGLNLLIFFSARRRQLPPGTLLGLMSVCYAPARFLLDYLRAVYIRYGGWTPGQYFSVVLLGFGLWVLTSRLERSDRPMTALSCIRSNLHQA